MSAVTIFAERRSALRRARGHPSGHEGLGAVGAPCVMKARAVNAPRFRPGRARHRADPAIADGASRGVFDVAGSMSYCRRSRTNSAGATRFAQLRRVGAVGVAGKVVAGRARGPGVERSSCGGACVRRRHAPPEQETPVWGRVSSSGRNVALLVGGATFDCAWLSAVPCPAHRRPSPWPMREQGHAEVAITPERNRHADDASITEIIRIDDTRRRTPVRAIPASNRA